jgi:predicted NUDIX family NTP pyrophosphohydrolase
MVLRRSSVTKTTSYAAPHSAGIYLAGKCDSSRAIPANRTIPANKVQMISMPRVSAGLLMYRIRDGKLQVLLAHPGGPFFNNKDEGAWTIPKGEVEPNEDLLVAAKREFEEEIGAIPAGPFIPLTPVKHKGGKIAHARAFEDDCNPTAIVSNTFTMEWPPNSGRQLEFPEIDRADFFEVDAARQKIKAAQMELIEEFGVILNPT